VQQDDTHGDAPRRLSRRAALQLGAGFGAAAVAAPYLARAAGISSEFDISSAEPALARIPNWPIPSIVTRAQWGANEALRKPGDVYDLSVVKLIVHHTGTPNSITDYPGLCRGILANETSGEYIDIAYNWLIDPNGLIYEGRWARDYPPGVPHTGESLGANVRGAHAIYNNARTIGVALMGTYDTIDPSPAMQNALVTLLAWKCARWGIDPMARGTYAASNGVVENIFNICGHRDTSPTDCPGQLVEPMLPAIRLRVAARLSGSGYWIATSVGQAIAFGGAPVTNNAGFRLPVATAGIAGHPSGHGYWLFGPDGSVYPFGAAGPHGSMRGRGLSAPIVGMASTPSGNGYWLVGSDGGIFNFGDAHFFGSTGRRRLSAPVFGMAPTRTGQGYWLCAHDGGIFSFGDAKFMGSTGGRRLNQPIVAMAARPQSDGYWLLAQDGGIFSFGRAPFVGSGTRFFTAPFVSILPSTTGNGYVLLRADGRVVSAGDAQNVGDAFGEVLGTAVGIAGRVR
jgi:hypothetical protein